MDIIFEAMEHAKIYPSIAKDAATNTRVVQYVLTGIWYKLRSLMKMFDTQAECTSWTGSITIHLIVWFVWDSIFYQSDKK